jgi:DNA-directed RNA polymerase subunit D
MELIEKNNEKMIWRGKMNISLANAIRRNVCKIPVLAVTECDIYKNDSVLYDEIIAHRLGLVPLKNQKMKEGESVEFKLKKKAGKEESLYLLSGELGEEVAIDNIPIVLLEKGQQVEMVVRAGVGYGSDHAKFTPGLMFYREIPKIKIGKNSESAIELSENYPEIFEFKDKLKVKNDWKCDFDEEDFKDHDIEFKYGDELLFSIESWGQMNPKDIFLGSVDAIKKELNEVLKSIK